MCGGGRILGEGLCRVWGGVEVLVGMVDERVEGGEGGVG